MGTLRFRIVVVATLHVLLCTANARTQEDANGSSPAHPATMTELRDLVRTLRQERQAHYRTLRERTRKIDETRAACEKLKTELADLRARENELDETSTEVLGDVERLRHNVNRDNAAQLKLTADLDQTVKHVTRMVEEGIPYRVDERRGWSTSDANSEAGDDTSRPGDRLARLWSLFQEEMRIARSGETCTARLALNAERVQHVRLFRVGHQILGYVTEDGTAAGIWFPRASGADWRHDLTGPPADSVRTAVGILDRRQRPRYVSLPARITPADTAKQDASDNRGSAENRH